MGMNTPATPQRGQRTQTPQPSKDTAKDRAKTQDAYEVEPGWKLTWRRFRRHGLAMGSVVLLIILHLSSIFAGFLAPYSETKSNRQKYYHPPTKIHFFDENGRLTRPYVYNYRLVDVGRRLYEPQTDKKYPIKFFVRGEPYKILGLFESNVHLYGVDSPAVIYPFGGDHFGRDVVSRLLFGSHKSLWIVWPATLVSLVIGLVYGGIAGYFGRRIDNVMMRLAEIVMAIPSFYLLLVLSGLLRDFQPTQRWYGIVLILSLISWAGLSRVIRGMVLAISRQEFVESARAIGSGNLRIIVRHILPNTMSYVIVSVTLSIPGFILGESSLSFLGVGIQEPQSSWGLMLNKATDLSALTRYPWLLVPGLFIFITVLAWNFVGDGVRDALDPRAAVGRK